MKTLRDKNWQELKNLAISRVDYCDISKFVFTLSDDQFYNKEIIDDQNSHVFDPT